MSTATDRYETTQTGMTVMDTTTSTPISEAHVSALAVPMVKIDLINNWTGVDELPFDPIAERALEMEANDEKGEHKGEFSVTFARPVEIEGKGWACLYRLSAMGRVHVSPARGIDAVDAIQAAFGMVHRQLAGMSRMHRITLSGSDDLGFAPPSTEAAPKAAGCPVMGGGLGA